MRRRRSGVGATVCAGMLEVTLNLHEPELALGRRGQLDKPAFFPSALALFSGQAHPMLLLRRYLVVSQSLRTTAISATCSTLLRAFSHLFLRRLPNPQHLRDLYEARLRAATAMLRSACFPRYVSRRVDAYVCLLPHFFLCFFWVTPLLAAPPRQVPHSRLHFRHCGCCLRYRPQSSWRSRTLPSLPAPPALPPPSNRVTSSVLSAQRRKQHTRRSASVSDASRRRRRLTLWWRRLLRASTVRPFFHFLLFHLLGFIALSSRARTPSTDAFSTCRPS
jgi:hypothetical protein